MSYTGIDFHGLIYDLTNGVRLPNPPFCPPPITSLLEKCFDEIPDKRPDFKVIKHYLDVIYTKLDALPTSNGIKIRKLENDEMKTRYTAVLHENKIYKERKNLEQYD